MKNSETAVMLTMSTKKPNHATGLSSQEGGIWQLLKLTALSNKLQQKVNFNLLSKLSDDLSEFE